MDLKDRTKRRYQKSRDAEPRKQTEWLSPKEQIFIGEYLKHLNASKAYRDAGYKVDNSQVGYLAAKQLARPKIQAAIQKAMDERAARTLVTIDKVVMELGKLAFTNMGDYYDKWDGTGLYLKPSVELTREQTAAIEAMETIFTPEGIKLKFKLYSKQAALQTLREHLVMPKVGDDDPNEFIRKLRQASISINNTTGLPPEGE